ncbi:Puromycin-sensitive aminopeptidase, partial [Geodia barretti]
SLSIFPSLAPYHSPLSTLSFCDSPIYCFLCPILLLTFSLSAPLDSMLRSLVIGAHGKYGNQATIEEAKARFQKHVEGTTVLPSDLKSAVFSMAMANGDETTFDQLVKLHADTDSNEEQSGYTGLWELARLRPSPRNASSLLSLTRFDPMTCGVCCSLPDRPVLGPETWSGSLCRRNGHG